MNVRIINVLSSLGLVAVLLAAVVADTHFPAAAAEKAADQVIGEIWQLKPMLAEKPDQAS